MLRGHQQDVGAVRGEGTAADRPRDHPREVEHADAGEGTVACRERLGRRVANPLDAEQRQARKRLTLRMVVPLGE